ncbi:hypothetical protein [Novacetimonas pomaceti]|uniref:Uncharacterized protein n=3 Tax=Novacetimonas pomaceti TaxID=2021998 RepID=A0A318QCN7_9PROT|nr:hypothetical protein [Novacetimonas pomaceti]PYD75594.1 hypothetical protein CFR71_08460 [Novacetimonas pomaceti]
MNRKILAALALLAGMSPVLATARPPGYYYGPRHERRWHRPIPPPVWRRPPPPIWGYGPPPPPPPPPAYPYW